MDRTLLVLLGLAVLAVHPSAADTDSVPESIVTALGHPDPFVRLAAVRIVREESPVGPEVVRALLPLVEDEDEEIAESAAGLLGRRGQPVASFRRELLRLLESAEPHGPTRSSLLAACAGAGATPAELAPFVSGVGNLDTIAWRLGPDAHAFVPLVLPAVEGWNVQAFLLGLDPPPHRHLPALVSLIDALEPSGRTGPLRLLGRVGSLPEVLPLLERRWTRPDPPVETFMALAGRAGELERSAIDPVELVSSGTDGESVAAVARLFRPDAISEPSVLAVLSQGAPWAPPMFGSEAKALGRVLGELPIDRLHEIVALLSAKDGRVRSVAMQALRSMLGREDAHGSAAVPRALAGLVAILRDDSRELRIEANDVLALARLPPDAMDRPLRQALIDACLTSGPERLVHACHPLQQFDGRAAPALPALLSQALAHCRGPSQRGRRDAVKAIVDVSWLAGHVEGPVPDLNELRLLLRCRDGDVRLFAARALGRLGPGAEPALGFLSERLEQESGDVRRELEVAIRRIDRTTWAPDSESGIVARSPVRFAGGGAIGR